MAKLHLRYCRKIREISHKYDAALRTNLPIFAKTIEYQAFAFERQPASWPGLSRA